MVFETKSPSYGNCYIVSPQLKSNDHKYWYVSDRITVLQIKLSNSEKCTYNIKETSSEFKDSVNMKVQQNGNHTSDFRFRKLLSNKNSFQVLNTLSASSTCMHQLVTLSEIMFLYSVTSTKISVLFSINLKASHFYF